MEHSHEHGSPITRLGDVWGHYGGESLIVAIAASILVGLFPQPGYAGLGLALAIIAGVVGGFVLMRRHDRRLCEMCMAHMPLNPSAEAERKKWRFWLAHNGSEMRFVGPYLAVVLGSSFAYDYIGKWVWAAIQASLIYLVLAQVTHRRLQPWCPWCRSGGDGVPESPEVLPEDDRLLI
ncbi:MAG: hypothetical protein ACTHMS_12850 [Jatrophihabitans sp.]|uniref:hypothetical protein n=1 Tax=Jatrophihabitans sp. TaxID=1932789 RepID=UPI003F7DFC62